MKKAIKPLAEKIHGFGIQRRKVKRGFYWEENVKEATQNLKKELEEKNNHIKEVIKEHKEDACAKEDTNIKDIILTDFSLYDLVLELQELNEYFENKINKAFEKHMGDLK